MIDSASGWVTEAAPAKVNLYLHVTGKRADGYHELDSLVCFSSVADVLHVGSGAPGVALEITGPFAAGLDGPVEDNLVVRAARTLADVAGIRPELSLRLEKYLPVASGIGGGSADAAATLRALNRFWNLSLSLDDLARIALPLGADVPMCVYGRPAIAQGIGETLTFLSAPLSLSAVLVNPGVAVSTPAVFAARTGAYSSGTKAADGDGGADVDWLAVIRQARNDLEGPASSLAGEIADVLTLLGTTGADLVRMSGSGATCFALYADEQAARAAAADLQRQKPEWWVQATVLG